MYKKAWCTCKVVVFLIKTIVFSTFSSPSAPSDLKVPIIFERSTSTGSEPFSLLISLDAEIFVLPSVLILIEMICPKKMFNIKAQECKKSTSGWRASLILKHPINMVYMFTWWRGDGGLRYCGIELFFFFFKRISIIFQFFLRYWGIENP